MPETRPVVSMSTLGSIGLFGNQVLQYAFLRLYARRHGLAVECPPWIGARLFGHVDPPLSADRPAVTEVEVDVASALRATTPPHTGCDFLGWFQVPTSAYAAERDAFRALFEPLPEVEAAVEPAWRRLRARGRTVVGLHVRRGNYRFHYGNPLVERLFLMAPVAWYRRWLERTLPRLDRPVVFLASDDPEVAAELAEFRPVTIAELGDGLPEAPGFAEFRLLVRCEALAISNSTFSFAAALLNRAAGRFARPDALAGELVEFDPWDAKPLLELPVERVLGRAPSRAGARAPDGAAAADEDERPAVAGELAVAGAPARALFGDSPRRGRVELAATLVEGGGGRLRVEWRDDDDPAWSFSFRATSILRAHSARPALVSGEGRAAGRTVDGEGYFLLAAAELASWPGRHFVALTLLTRERRSFFVELSATGALAVFDALREAVAANP